jgi:hypothetical protein
MTSPAKRRIDDPPVLLYGSLPMHIIRLLAVPALLLACQPALGQVDVKLRTLRKQFVAGEAVTAEVSITNHAGRDLVFQGDGRVSWLDFVVKDEGGEPVTLSARNQFGAVRIPAGQTMSRRVDLSRSFRVRTMGNYSVYAVVRLPGQRSDGFLSNRVLFTVTKARPYWSQKVGLKSRPGQTREFRLLTYSGPRKTSIYAEVLDDRTGQSLATYSLGEALLFRKPQATVDGNQVMHVLFLSTPSLWCHVRVDVEGRLLGRQLHQRGVSSEPRLVTFGTGEVRVAGSVPYDPELERQLKGQVRGISERPGFVYE